MHIGCPKEIKPQEFRVGLTPNAAREAIAHGHTVTVETQGGIGAGFTDEDYIEAGAKIAGTAADIFAAADMIVKVKEPQPVERAMLREGQLLFTYLHLAPDPEQTKDRMRYLDDVFSRDFKTMYASAGNTIELAREADMVIGAVLIPGAAAPKLISRAQLSEMKPGAAIVDVAIDQGGCFETSKATTHQDPIYEVDGIMHYCVANMPGAVARTSTIALGNATMPFMLALADKGWKQACEEDEHLLNGLNVHAGQLTYFAVGKALGMDVLSPQLALKV